MVEAGAKEVSEETMLEAIAFGHGECRRLARVAEGSGRSRPAKPRWAFDPNAGTDRRWPRGSKSLAAPKLAAALATHEKHARAEAVAPVFDEVWAGLGLDDGKKGAVRAAFEEVEKRRGAPA